jgi:uncharacterized protein (TIGR02452 family)
MHISREHAAALGHETVQIVRAGTYQAPSGRLVDLRAATAEAKAGTQTYPPERDVPLAATGQQATQISVTSETTLSAASRLVAAGHRPVALNFASARQPGGGFLSGARAQEESPARASALFACLEGNTMYAWHEVHRNPLYSHYAIYSPAVPVFRADSGALLDAPYLCSFITCPAVNAAVALERDHSCRPVIRETMAGRIDRVLAIAAAQGHSHLILGAWGCGAFGNDPHVIASLFQTALLGPYAGAFAEVVFAIVDWSKERRFIGPFERTLGAGSDHGKDA